MSRKSFERALAPPRKGLGAEWVARAFATATPFQTN